MHKIKTLSDLITLKSQISPSYHQVVSEQFYLLAEALKDPYLPIEDFTLERDGFLVLITEDTDLMQLHEVGLPTGLLESWPEYVEVLSLADGITIYRIAILYTNDYMMFFYIDQKLIADEPVLLKFIQDQLEYEELTLAIAGGEDNECC